jgi:hypothetical protein
MATLFSVAADDSSVKSEKIPIGFFSRLKKTAVLFPFTPQKDSEIADREFKVGSED